MVPHIGLIQVHVHTAELRRASPRVESRTVPLPAEVRIHTTRYILYMYKAKAVFLQAHSSSTECIRYAVPSVYAVGTQV